MCYISDQYDSYLDGLDEVSCPKCDEYIPNDDDWCFEEDVCAECCECEEVE